MGALIASGLNGNWGIVDVDDCVNGARYLVERGEADGERLIIRGGSAGGYTHLRHDVSRRVQSGRELLRGGDLEALEEDCHNSNRATTRA